MEVNLQLRARLVALKVTKDRNTQITWDLRDGCGINNISYHLLHAHMCVCMPVCARVSMQMCSAMEQQRDLVSVSLVFFSCGYITMPSDHANAQAAPLVIPQMEKCK